MEFFAKNLLAYKQIQKKVGCGFMSYLSCGQFNQ